MGDLEDVPIIDPEDDELDPDLEAAMEAVFMLACPYFRRGGKCQSGCHSEPACKTDEPIEGWTHQLLVSAQALSDPPTSVQA